MASNMWLANKIQSIKGELFVDCGRICFIIIPEKLITKSSKKILSERKNSKKVVLFVLSQQLQDTVEYPYLIHLIHYLIHSAYLIIHSYLFLVYFTIHISFICFTYFRSNSEKNCLKLSL